MPTMPPLFKAHGVRGRVETNKIADVRRGSPRTRGYDNRWRKARATHLARSPLCRYCEVGAFGPPTVTAADTVDHFYPHEGDQVLFWLTGYWVSSCAACHSGPKQAIERQGRKALDALAPRLGLAPKSDI